MLQKYTYTAIIMDKTFYSNKYFTILRFKHLNHNKFNNYELFQFSK